MLKTRLFRLINDTKLSVPVIRRLHHEFSQPEPPKKLNENQESKHEAEHVESANPFRQPENITGALSQKYKLFREAESPEILDIFEERERYQTQDAPEAIEDDLYMNLNLNRGVTGVFDIEDLVDVLRKENAEDVFVCSVPNELKYIDYLVVCSGRSYRHMLAMAEFVRRVYKLKRQSGDILPRIEGEKSKTWMAMDLGNIALHIFSPVARETYDLESLWAVGVEYDRECNKPRDPLVELFEKHSTLLADIKPHE